MRGIVMRAVGKRAIGKRAIAKRAIVKRGFGVLRVAAIGLGLLAAAPAFPADPAAGKAKAASCAACHGQAGIATAPDAPHLAGQPEDYLVEQLRAYRVGTRKHEVMTLMARPLSDVDIANLAAWFASQKIDIRS